MLCKIVCCQRYPKPTKRPHKHVLKCAKYQICVFVFCFRRPEPPSSSHQPGRESGKLSQAQIDKLKARNSLSSSNKASGGLPAPARHPQPQPVEPRAFPGERGYRETSTSSKPQQQPKTSKPKQHQQPVESRAFPGERGYREPGSASTSSRNNRDR